MQPQEKHRRVIRMRRQHSVWPGRGRRVSVLRKETLGGVRNAKAETGSVTAEFAILLPAMTVLLAILLFSVAAGILQLRLEEGARAGARALARGDSSVEVLEIVARVSGQKVDVSVGTSGGYATVTVQGRVGGVLSGLIQWTQTAHSSVKVEVQTALLLVRHKPIQRNLLGGARALRTALWRWARSDEYLFRSGLCGGSAVALSGSCVVRG